MSEIINKGVGIYIRFKAYLAVGIIIVFSVFTLQKFLWATEIKGIGIRTDSVAYLWGSENLANGIGLGRLDGAGNFRPYTHWPPLYPILLTVPRLLNIDGMESARIIGAFCIALLILVAGLAVARLTDNSPWYSAAALMILINAPSLWVTSLYAMSEPLYIALSLAAMLLFDLYQKRQKRSLLVISALVMGLALITRYVGISLIVASGLMLLVQKNRQWAHKLKDGLLLAGIALTPFLIWVVRNMLIAGTTTNRALDLVAIKSIEWQQTWQALQEWVKPLTEMSPVGFFKPMVIVLLTLIASAVYFKFAPGQKENTKNGFWLLITVCTLSYILFTVVARLLFDQYIPLYEVRIMFPVFIGIFLVVLFLLFALQENSRRMGWLPPALLACLYVMSAWAFSRAYIQVTAGRSDSILTSSRNDGIGIIKIAGDPLYQVLDQFPQRDHVFFTDNIEKFYFLSGLYSYQIFSSQPDQVNRITNELADRGVVMALFDKKSLGPQLQSILPGLELIHLGTADVYAIPSR